MQDETRSKRAIAYSMLPSGSIDQAIAHAAQEWPRESCGVILADGYHPMANLAAGGTDSFEMDYLIDDSVFAVVHSHPGASPEPSPQDRIACTATDVPWLIVTAPGDARELVLPASPDDPLEGRHFIHGYHDCWGVVHSWYRQVAGKEIANPIRHDGWWDEGGDMYRELLPVSGFDHLGDSTDMVAGDVILMQIRAPVPNHAAVYLGDGKMLHHMHGRPSEIVPYGGMWEKLTVGVWRYVA